MNCPQGHPYDEKNTYVDVKGTKNCRLCNHHAVKNYRGRRLAAGFCMTCGKVAPKVGLESCQNCLDKMVSRARKTKYGISAKECHQMLIDQGGVCAICKTLPDDKALCVDHNHETGVVRGLLCLHCNTGIGNFRDDPHLLDAAMRYVTDG